MRSCAFEPCKCHIENTVSIGTVSTKSLVNGCRVYGNLVDAPLAAVVDSCRCTCRDFGLNFAVVGIQGWTAQWVLRQADRMFAVAHIIITDPLRRIFRKRTRGVDVVWRLWILGKQTITGNL